MVNKKIKKMTEKEKEERIAYLEGIISLLPANVYWKNRAGVYLGCNPRNAKVCLNKKPKDIIGKTLLQIVPKKYATAILKTDEEIMKSGKPRTLEEKYYDEKGGEATYLTQKAPLFDDKGKVIGLVGVSFNITDRKLLLGELEQAKKRLEESYKKQAGFISDMDYIKNIISVMPGNVFWQDVKGIYLGCNKNLSRIHGLSSPKEIIGKKNYDLMSKSLARKTNKNDRLVVSQGKFYSFEENGTDETGQPAVYLTTKVPLYDQNKKVSGMLGTSVNITARIQQAKLLQEAKVRAEIASSAKSNFIATVSHELRTPLNGILGAADILTREKISPPQLELVNDIIQSSEHLLLLINDLLDFAKLEAEKIELHPQFFDFNKMVAGVITSSRYLLEEKNVELTLRYNAPTMIEADQLRLKQILVNLISNAIKHTRHGSIKVSIHAKHSQKNYAKFHVAVEDTGCGIPESKLESIFDRFTQLKQGDSEPAGGGVGLGLAICRKLAKLMRSTIQVKSTVGKGTTFWFEIDLPVREIKSEVARSTKATKKLRSSVEKLNCNILLIEDEQVNQKVITMMLEDLGCKVDLAATGQQALKMYKPNKYDAVLTDIGLPDIKGEEVTRRIRAQESPGQRQLIIGVTAHATLKEQSTFQKAGLDGIVTKPLRQIDLLRALQKYNP